MDNEKHVEELKKVIIRLLEKANNAERLELVGRFAKKILD